MAPDAIERGRNSPLSPPTPMEVWGGLECTHNRVRDRYFDQYDLAGHTGRSADIELVASLGIRTLRLGLLWERFARDNSWHWSDGRLAQLAALNISPIAGLLHHGSGPPHTGLLDPGFPEKLSQYAGEVAARYPSIAAYTPVNEPHTTARFSGLYGIWYPHHMSQSSYIRALLNQIKATVLSMRAIRAVRSDAILIQTEDVGRISGTYALESTWERMNERQWLTFDLLCGLVDRHHSLFAYLRSLGIEEKDILWFRDNPCPPSIIGINYYATSDRFLDHRTSLYRQCHMSAEGHFADVEAVRVEGAGLAGIGTLLHKAWKRYGIPLAVTEVHLGCTPDEQVRWLSEMWNDAQRARKDGVPCVAFTVWALLGSFFWNELVTRDNGHYEPGVFDVRSGTPLATELTSVVQQIARGEAPQHPTLAQPGWWNRDDRALFPCDDSLIETAA